MKFRSSNRAFTLVEIMIVIAVIGLFLGIGIPSMFRSFRKEGMRKAVGDMLEACGQARANAILSGSTVELIIRPKDGSIQVSGGSSPSADAGNSGEQTPSSLKTTAFSSTLPGNIAIEFMGVNFQESQDAEETRVRFYPNGTCDEFSILLRSDTGEYRKINLEIVTALANSELVR